MTIESPKDSERYLYSISYTAFFAEKEPISGDQPRTLKGRLNPIILEEIRESIRKLFDARNVVINGIYEYGKFPFQDASLL